MAVYLVLNTTVQPQRCSQGHRHIQNVQVTSRASMFTGGTMTQLLAMQTRTPGCFVVAPRRTHRDAMPIAFLPCPCGSGYIAEPDGVVDEVVASGARDIQLDAL